MIYQNIETSVTTLGKYCEILKLGRKNNAEIFAMIPVTSLLK